MIMGIVITAISVIVSCVGLFFINHYVTYKYHPWEKKYMKIVKTNWGDADTISFKRQYEDHCRQTTSPTTRSMSFENFESIYNINPQKWKFKEYNGHDIDFVLKYRVKEPKYSCSYDLAENYVQVIFNQKDFNKYRRWLAARAKLRQEHKTIEAQKQDYDAMQKILTAARNDIDTMETRARKEVSLAADMVAAAANNQPCPNGSLIFDTINCNYYIKKDNELIQIAHTPVDNKTITYNINSDGSLTFNQYRDEIQTLKVSEIC